MINKVLIVGGTHGNETSGTTLLHSAYKSAINSQFGGLTINFAMGNPRACKQNIRYTEEDLNRQFSLTSLATEAQCYEALRAQEINQQYGPKAAPTQDIVIDIHNTTSNMGPTLIVLQADEFHIGLSRYVKQHMPSAVILVEDEKPPQDHPYLCTIGKRGLMVEVGPQEQGVCRATITQQAFEMIQHILAFCELWNNKGRAVLTELTVAPAFRLDKVVEYPLSDSGERVAMIHPELQDRDFHLLQAGDPVFAHFDGNVTTWDGEPTYPHFINEAAYQHLQIAFATADSISL
ncbi:aspartoacylase [Alteromonas sediminis]|uniref:Aspartoacylase n=1 Tax=Alteromonas sediminis TaxID=2259342 RepID=A0A3N5Y686_9ALTE|nr:aspartoacylase [Alteromonas sediminis]RPJ68806.1 aspartoacylase [Alteromonas sediminis]